MTDCPQTFSLQTFSFAPFPGAKEPLDGLAHEWICQEPCPAHSQLLNNYDPVHRAFLACFLLSFSRTVILLLSYPCPSQLSFLSSSAFWHTASPATHPPRPTSVSGPPARSLLSRLRDGAVKWEEVFGFLGIHWPECNVSCCGSCSHLPSHTKAPERLHQVLWLHPGHFQDLFPEPGSPWFLLWGVQQLQVLRITQRQCGNKMDWLQPALLKEGNPITPA